jgi:hypothetical protein
MNYGPLYEYTTVAEDQAASRQISTGDAMEPLQTNLFHSGPLFYQHKCAPLGFRKVTDQQF